MDLLDIIRSAGKTASRVGNSLSLGMVIGAYGNSSNGSSFGGRTLTSPRPTGQETIPTPDSSFVNNVTVDYDNNASIVTMNSGASYRYHPQYPDELDEIRTFAKTTGHFGKKYWQDTYRDFYKGRPSRNRI